jgi:hypothetical protein
MTLQQYMKLLCQGQTNALDMLFAPPEFVLESSIIWDLSIRAGKQHFLSRNCKAFVGYCRQQTKKYAVRQDRFDALQEGVNYLKCQLISYTRLEIDLGLVRLIDIIDLRSWADKAKFTKIVDITLSNDSIVPHLEICDTRVPLTATIETALDTYEGKLASYGQRIRSAHAASTKDWKSLYHAVRVAEQAKELVSEGKITFPRPEKDYLLKIRRGEIFYEEVANRIERSVEDIERLAAESALPEKPNKELANKIVQSAYTNRIVEEWIRNALK